MSSCRSRSVAKHPELHVQAEGLKRAGRAVVGGAVAAGDNPPTTAPSGGSPSSPASSRAEVRPSRTPPHPLLHTRSQLPQSSLLTTYLRAPPCPPACGLVHVLASPPCLAGYELARPSEYPGARATSPSARPSFGVALRPLSACFRTQPPLRTFLRPTPARACMCSQPMLIWQEQGSHWRWCKLDS